MKLCEILGLVRTPEYQEFSLLEVLTDIIADFKLTNQKISLKFNSLNIVSTGLSSFSGDEKQLKFAFYNLFKRIFEVIPKNAEKSIKVDISYEHKEKHFLVFDIHAKKIKIKSLLNNFFDPQAIAYIEQHEGDIEFADDQKFDFHLKISLPFHYLLR